MWSKVRGDLPAVVLAQLTGGDAAAIDRYLSLEIVRPFIRGNICWPLSDDDRDRTLVWQFDRSRIAFVLHKTINIIDEYGDWKSGMASDGTC
jgi:hypothetical protein